jgi:ArsR family transcriptional regulator, arsenate/arsenite/antimonite-responsive transcriptional repressor
MSDTELATDIEVCQYRCMSKLLPLLDPAGTAGCCPPLSAGPLSAAQAEQVAPQLKALADPVRLRLMSLVASHPGGEACVCDLNDAFDLTQPTISHHLKVLHEAGLLDRDKRGVWVYYRARTRALASLATLIGTASPLTDVLRPAIWETADGPRGPGGRA